MDLIRKLRQQSEGDRMRFASLLSFSVTFLLFVVWVSYLLFFYTAEKAIDADQQRASLVEQVKKTFKDAVNMGAQVKE